MTENLTEGQNVTLKRLAGIATWAEGGNGQVIAMEFEVDNDSDIFKIEVRYDPTIVDHPNKLVPVLDQMREQIGPHNHTVWDDATLMLLAQLGQNL